MRWTSSDAGPTARSARMETTVKSVAINLIRPFLTTSSNQLPLTVLTQVNAPSPTTDSNFRDYRLLPASHVQQESRIWKAATHPNAPLVTQEEFSWRLQRGSASPVTQGAHRAPQPRVVSPAPTPTTMFNLTVPVRQYVLAARRVLTGLRGHVNHVQRSVRIVSILGVRPVRVASR